jgi:hypothetical protein
MELEVEEAEARFLLLPLVVQVVFTAVVVGEQAMPKREVLVCQDKELS